MAPFSALTLVVSRQKRHAVCESCSSDRRGLFGQKLETFRRKTRRFIPFSLGDDVGEVDVGKQWSFQWRLWSRSADHSDPVSGREMILHSGVQSSGGRECMLSRAVWQGPGSKFGNFTRNLLYLGIRENF